MKVSMDRSTVRDDLIRFVGVLGGAQEGDWFPHGLKKRSFSGLFGYQVFLALAVFMGDGLYNLIKVRLHFPSPHLLGPSPLLPCLLLAYLTIRVYSSLCTCMGLVCVPVNECMNVTHDPS